MISTLKQLLNFKKTPDNILLFAIPLAVLGMGFHYLYAYLIWVSKDDATYLVIMAIATLGLLGSILWLRKMFNDIGRIKVSITDGK